MAIKFILLVLIVLAAYWLFTARRAGKHPGTQTNGAKAERMVVCAHCSLHLPLSESISEAGRYYCCDEHRALDTH